MKYHWIVIDTLIECIEHGIDTKKVKLATLRLDMELDRCLVNNLPINEIEKLKSILERINYTE